MRQEEEERLEEEGGPPVRADPQDPAFDRARRLALACRRCGWAPARRQAAFGLLPGEAGFKVTATADAGGAPATLAGAHPYSLVTEINFNKVGNFSDGDLKDLDLRPAAGADRKRDLGATGAAPRSSRPRASPPTKQASRARAARPHPDRHRHPGELPRAAAKPGPSGSSTSRRRRARPRASASRPTASRSRSPRACAKPAANTGSPSSSTTSPSCSTSPACAWRSGAPPSAIAHDGQRGNCLNETDPSSPHAQCPVSELNPPHPAQAYLTLPSNCDEAARIPHLAPTSWQAPAAQVAALLDQRRRRSPLCDKLAFNPIPRGELSTDRTSPRAAMTSPSTAPARRC